MRTSFTNFWRRNLAFARLAAITQMEYRLNYAIDALVAPLMLVFIELTLWLSLFAIPGRERIGGFDQNSYLSYVLWTAFISRISTTWMFEHRMIQEIETGTINTLLTRPLNFFEYYMSQFLGYKLMTSFFSLFIPMLVVAVMGLPTIWGRLVSALALVVYHLFFVQLLSFILATSAFHLTRVQGVSLVKNLFLGIVCGEWIPLDLVSEPLRHILLALPFSSGVFLPVAYITGRIDGHTFAQGFISTTVGLIVLGVMAPWAWKKGLEVYDGTGA